MDPAETDVVDTQNPISADRVQLHDLPVGEASNPCVLQHIRVRTMDQSTHNLRVNPNESVTNLKSKITVVTNVPGVRHFHHRSSAAYQCFQDRQRLIYRGRVMSDAHSLTEYVLAIYASIHTRKDIIGITLKTAIRFTWLRVQLGQERCPRLMHHQRQGPRNFPRIIVAWELGVLLQVL